MRLRTVTLAALLLSAFANGAAAQDAASVVAAASKATGVDAATSRSGAAAAVSRDPDSKQPTPPARIHPVVTIAIIWAGFKMIFQGARLADVANVLIGGTLVGGAAAFASYIVT